MDKVANLPEENRNELFSETARQMHTTNAIVEKDFWVVWTLDKLFSDDRLNKILMFKGGTSLSKVFNLIGRFSEDIDLILDWELLTGENPYADRTKNKQTKFNEQINEDAKIGTLKLLPPEFRYKELKEDYASMRNMIFDKYIEFDEIMSILRDLEDEINSMEK